jgi:hypothetical protein
MLFQRGDESLPFCRALAFEKGAFFVALWKGTVKWKKDPGS